MRNKTLLYGVIFALIVLGACFPFARRIMLQLAVQDELDKLGRFPTPAQIVSLDDVLLARAGKLWISQGSVKPTVRYAERKAGPVSFFYVEATLDYGWVVSSSRKVELAPSPELFEQLEEGGVEVSLLSGGDDEGAEGEDY